MNKYTLTFLTQELEHQYQIHRLTYTIQTCKIINLIFVFFCLLRIIFSLLIFDTLNIAIFVPVLLVVIISHIIVIYKQNNWIDFYLLFANHLLMIYQIYVEDDFKPQEAYVFGTGMMTLHIIIIFVSDFKYAALQIFTATFVKLTICGIFQNDTTFQTYTFESILPFLLTFTLYKNNKQYRESFLFTQNQTSLDWLIPLIVSNPYAMFIYNEKTLSFQIKLSNFAQYNLFQKNQNNYESFIQLIRNYSLSSSQKEDGKIGQTLEQFILCNKRNETFLNKQYLISNNKNPHTDKILIRYSKIFVTELTYIIVLDQKAQEIQKLKNKEQQVKNGIQKVIKFTQTLLLKQYKVTSNLKFQISTLYKVKINIIYALIKFNCKIIQQSEQNNLIIQIKDFINFYEVAFQQKVILEYSQFFLDQCNNYHQINELLVILMIHASKLKLQIFKIILLSIPQQNIQFTDFIIETNNSNKLHNSLSKSKQFRFILQKITPNSDFKIQNDEIVIRLYQNIGLINSLNPFQQKMMKKE